MSSEELPDQSLVPADQNMPVKSTNPLAVQNLSEEGVPKDWKKYFPEGYKCDLVDRGTLYKIGRAVGIGNSTEIMTPSILPCKGPECPIVKDKARSKDRDKPRDFSNCLCPLYRQGLEPEGHPCPLESMSADIITNGLVEALGLSPHNIAHRLMVSELSGLILIQARILKEASLMPSAIVEDVMIKSEDMMSIGPTDVPEEGDDETPGKILLIRKRVNPIFEALKRITDMISRSREQLIATPEKQLNAAVSKMRAKKDIAVAETHSVVLANLKRKHDKADKEIIAGAVIKSVPKPPTVRLNEEMEQAKARELNKSYDNAPPDLEDDEDDD